MITILISCKSGSTTEIGKAVEKTNNLVLNSSVTVKDDVIINFTKYGNQKELMVFVHGWSCDQTYWNEQIDFFKEKYQIVTIDLAGHGNSSKGLRSYWTISNLSEDVVSVLKNFNYDKIILVGHSLGSMVVIEAASQLEIKDVSIVAVDYLKRPLNPLPEEAVDGFLTKFKSDFKGATKEFASNFFLPNSDSTIRNSIIGKMSSASPEVAIPLSKDLAIRDFTKSFESLELKNVKRYIINSDLSPIDETHYKAYGFSMSVIPKTGHFLMIEKPKEFNLMLDSLITKKGNEN